MPELPQTRHSLLIRLADQSQDAWVDFVQIYEQSLLAFARSKGLQDADAHDLSQQVMQAVEKKLANWNPDSRHGSFRGWLFRVARNIAVDKTIARVRGPVTSLTAVSEQADMRYDSTHESLFDLQFAREVFIWALDQARPHFSELTWQAFHMTAIGDEKPPDVASKLGISVGKVYAAKFRVIAKLQKLVRGFRESCELPTIAIWDQRRSHHTGERAGE